MGERQSDDGNDGIQGATCMSSDAKCGVRVQGGEGGRAVTCEQNRIRQSTVVGHVRLAYAILGPDGTVTAHCMAVFYGYGSQP